MTRTVAYRWHLAIVFVPASLVPSRLARRWLQTAERKVPLLVDSPEIISERVSIALPPGRSG